MVLDGTEGHHMFDNLTITRRGQILLQEDPGARDYLATIWRYSIADDTLEPWPATIRIVSSRAVPAS